MAVAVEADVIVGATSSLLLTETTTALLSLKLPVPSSVAMTLKL